MGDICVGVGFRSGSTAADILGAIRQMLAFESLGSGAEATPCSGAEATPCSGAELHCLGTLDRKADDDAVVGAASALGIPVVGFDVHELAAVPVPNPSPRVGAEIGSPSVAEAAALLCAGGGSLVVTKWSANGVVVAAARKVSRVRDNLIRDNSADV
ncbi:MAG: cobalamin biosynthesis protein [Rhodococcus sp. (in: high G+C Gram-positive bacteria)]|uniref:cobalamin biosynthesis protein n=1 Tax=Rhodococcus sp. TaxID=1831 RepID=UPI003BB0C3D7